MLTRYAAQNHGKADHGWLKSLFHFSFAEYYNPRRVQFGALRVVNDDLVKAGTGFDMHPHQNMEIISYVIDGQLTHGDSLNNSNTISRGHIQYMSSGTGIMHSEYNKGTGTLRFLQIWINPDQRGLKPYYGDYRYAWEDRKNRFLHLVSPTGGDAPVQINADANIYAADIDKGLNLEFPVGTGRQAYVIQIEGSSQLNNVILSERDSLESVEEGLIIKAIEPSHLMIIEMPKQ